MKKNAELMANGQAVRMMKINGADFICLTNIARFKNPEFHADVMRNWMRSKMTVAFLGLWEQLHNPDFNMVEFDQFKNEAGMTHQQWQAANHAQRQPYPPRASPCRRSRCPSRGARLRHHQPAHLHLQHGEHQRRHDQRECAAETQRVSEGSHAASKASERTSTAKWLQGAAHSPAATPEEVERNRHPANAHSLQSGEAKVSQVIH